MGKIRGDDVPAQACEVQAGDIPRPQPRNCPNLSGLVGAGGNIGQGGSLRRELEETVFTVGAQQPPSLPPASGPRRWAKH